MPTDVELSQALDGIRRVVNLNGAGVGSLLAPRLRGVESVPAVVGLVAKAVTQTFGSTMLTLVWEEPPGIDILGYRVWATNILRRNAAPALLGEFQHSPAQVLATSDINTTVIISVQTVLNNGLTNRLGNCPTVTVPVTVPTTVIPDGSVGDSKLDRVTANKIKIVADDIVAGQIETSKLSIYSVLVDGLTLTDNSPGAGSIAWSGTIKVYHQGVAYSISSGNTSSQFVVWTPGTTTFTGVDSYTGSVYLIATNVAGAGHPAWDRGGTALGSIQEENLNFGLLAGLEMQPVSATVMTDPTVAGTSAPLVGSANLITVNQACLLQTLSFYVVTPFTTTPVGGNPTVDMTLRLAITTDGGTTRYLKIIEETGNVAPQSLEFSPDALIWCPLGSGVGLVAGDKAAGIIGITAKNSLVVDLEMYISDGNVLAGNKTLYGEMRVGIGYAVKL